MSDGSAVKTAEEGFELTGEVTPVRELLANLWSTRWMVRMLSRRNFFTRYRRASFGAMWSVVLPLVQAAVLSVIFTRVVRIETPIPYPVFVLSGLVAWSFFSTSLTDAVRSITGGGIATQVYFPRAALPLVSVGSSMYSLVPNVAVLLVAMAAFRVQLRPHLVLLVPALALMVALTAAFALVLAAMQVYMRDVAFILAAAIQAWFYASAVIFPVERVDGLLRTLVLANPATGMVEMFRVAILGFRPYSGTALAFSGLWLVLVTGAALLLYRRFDRVFVDLL